MKHFVLIVLLFFISNCALSQTIIRRDPEIEAMVNEISTDSLKKYVSDLVDFKTRHTLSTQTDANKGIGAARDYVLEKFKRFSKNSNGRMKAYIDTTTLKPDSNRVDRQVLLGNVMAEINGSEKADDDRVFIMSGHLDSRRSDIMDSIHEAPGANDDLSGVAGVIETARILSKKEFDGKIILVAVSGEEQGLLGSQYLADKAKKEDWNIIAMINNDMIGGNDSNETNIVDNTRVRIFSEGIPLHHNSADVDSIIRLGLENDSPSRQLARYTKEIGERYVDNLQVDLEYRTDRFLRGGDHLPFMKNGFTAVRLVEMYENYNHQHQDVRQEDGIQYGDLIDFVDFEYDRKNTGVNVAVLANLLKSPGSPNNVHVETKELTNRTTITWAPPKEHEAKAYYVLMRPTASSVWTKKYYTTDEEMVLPYSKDNYFFAVQSVTDDGNESLPVVPVP